jgi:rhomboid protease GluP
MSEQPERPVNETPRQPITVKMPGRKPIVTYILIGITSLIFAGQYFIQGRTGYDLLFILGGKINEAIMAGQVWRLITPALLHGSILHLAMNMYALYVIGRRLERFYGPGKFLLLYLLSAYAGNVLSFVLTRNSSLGSSTAIFGLFAAEGIFILQNRKLFGPIRTRQMITNLVIVLVINLVYGFMPGSAVDIMGHIGGLLGGVFFAWKGGPVLKLIGVPPQLEVKDARKTAEMWLAAVIVLIGFTIIAMIPFVSG